MTSKTLTQYAKLLAHLKMSIASKKEVHDNEKCLYDVKQCLHKTKIFCKTEIMYVVFKRYILVFQKKCDI